MIFKSFNIYNILLLVNKFIYFYGPTVTDVTTEEGDGYNGVFTPNPNSSARIKTKDGTDKLISLINSFLDKYTELACGIFAILTITLVAVAMINFSSLGASSNNPNARRMAITKILLTCIASVLMGGLTIIIAIVYTIFR